MLPSRAQKRWRNSVRRAGRKAVHARAHQLALRADDGDAAALVLAQQLGGGLGAGAHGRRLHIAASARAAASDASTHARQQHCAASSAGHAALARKRSCTRSLSLCRSRASSAAHTAARALCSRSLLAHSARAVAHAPRHDVLDGRRAVVDKVDVTAGHQAQQLAAQAARVGHADAAEVLGQLQGRQRGRSSGSSAAGPRGRLGC